MVKDDSLSSLCCGIQVRSLPTVMDLYVNFTGAFDWNIPKPVEIYIFLFQALLQEVRFCIELCSDL